MPTTRQVVNDALREGDVLVGDEGGRTVVRSLVDWEHWNGDSLEAQFVAATTEHGILLLDPEGVSTVLWASQDRGTPTNTLPTPIGVQPVTPAAVPLFAAVPVPPVPWQIDNDPTECGPVQVTVPPAIEVDIASLPSYSRSGSVTRVIPAMSREKKPDEKPDKENATPAATTTASDPDPDITLDATIEVDDHGVPTITTAIVPVQAPNGEIIPEDPEAAARNAGIISGESGLWVPEGTPAATETPSLAVVRAHDWGSSSVPFRPCFDTSCEADCSFCGAVCGTGCPYAPTMGSDICTHDNVLNVRTDDVYPHVSQILRNK